MTAPALRGTSNRTPDPIRANNLVEHGENSVHPDVQEFAASLGRPVSRSEMKLLQATYFRGMLDRIEAEDDGPAIWRTVGNRSTPADPQGDRIARRLSAA